MDSDTLFRKEPPYSTETWEYYPRLPDLYAEEEKKALVTEGGALAESLLDIMNDFFPFHDKRLLEEKALFFLEANWEKIDVNWQGWKDEKHTILHKACRCNFSFVVEKLMKHPKTNPNLLNKHGETPLCVACDWCESNYLCARPIILHPECKLIVDKDLQQKNPFMQSIFWNHFEILELMLASGKGLEQIEAGLEFAAKEKSKQCEFVLKVFADPKLLTACIQQIRVKNNLPDWNPARLLLLIVLVCEGFLRLRSDPLGFLDPKKSRFFRIAIDLPFDLQMILCNRLFGYSENVISSILFNEVYLFLGKPILIG